ncbi:MAG TPA: ATP-binding protein [Candidatus Aquicultor sp.]|jgi:anti-sigma regulatory factor (Ser/Thr protein kinase)
MANIENSSLLSFVANLTGDQYLKIEEDFGQGFVRLNISEAERRQAKHDIQSMEDIVLEMLRNSRDAGAKTIFVASTKEDNLIRKVTIIDDGDGVPVELHERIFEPRVTSKLENVITDRYGIHGRGMALFSIKQVADEVELVFAAPGRGSVFKVETSTGLLNEKKDQSTYPTIKYRKGEPIIIRGPHNIIRTVLEFNLDNQDLVIYLGSPTEILTTMCYLCAQDQVSLGEKSQDFKIWRCVNSAKSAAMLTDIAERRLGLRVSIRNAQRIMSARVEGVKPILETLTGQQESIKPQKQVDLLKEEPLTRRIASEDFDSFARDIGDSFRALGEKYFIELSEAPDIQAERDSVRITLRLKKKGN